MLIKNYCNQKGQSLIELLLAIGLAAILIPAIFGAIYASREGKAQERQRLEASLQLVELKEAMRSIREKGWSNIENNGTFYPSVSGSNWSLVSGTTTTNGFIKQITISDVYRDTNGVITASAGYLDVATKKITYTVSWNTPISSSVSSEEYLTRTINNTVVTLDTTQSDFNNGTLDNVRVATVGDGAIELKPGNSNPTFVDDYIDSDDYNYNANKIEITNGLAQLKNQGTQVTGNTTNSNFINNANGWSFSTFSQNAGQTGAYQATGGNPDGYLYINFISDRNKTAGGYWHQAITTTAANPTATLNFQYRILNYQATPDVFRVYAYLDSGLGTPTTQVWSSGNITATSAWSSTVSVNLAPYMTTPGTYYLKMVAYVDYPNNTRGPYRVGFDNVSLSWSGTTQIYASDSPTVVSADSFAASSISSWDSFTETATTNGGSIRYQLSDDNGTTWKYFKNNQSGWVTVSGSSDYNDASTINQKISTFPIINKQIKIKAFLIGNGSQQVILDKITIGYTGSVGINYGTFTSSAFDAGSTVVFHRILWTESNTSNTETKIKIATSDDNSNWEYLGPDGTSGTYYTNGDGTIPLDRIEARYIKYQITFSSTNNDLPNVSDVKVVYSP